MKAVEGSKRIQRFPVNGRYLLNRIPLRQKRTTSSANANALRLMLQEKERAVRTLQETVEVYSKGMAYTRTHKLTHSLTHSLTHTLTHTRGLHTHPAWAPLLPVWDRKYTQSKVVKVNVCDLLLTHAPPHLHLLCPLIGRLSAHNSFFY